MTEYRGMSHEDYDEAMRRFSRDCHELARRLDEPTIRVGRTYPPEQGTDDDSGGCIAVLSVLALIVTAGVLASVVVAALTLLGAG